MAWTLRIVLGAILGGALAYLASRLLCSAGRCPITSNRPLMMAIGAALGAWLALSGCTSAGISQRPVFGAELTTPEEYQTRVLQSETPAAVDFYADWCGWCRKLEPILAKLERDYGGRIVFFRVNTDRAKALADQHDIRGLPTLLLYRDGEEVGRVRGFRGEEELRQQLDRLLPAG